LEPELDARLLQREVVLDRLLGGLLGRPERGSRNPRAVSAAAFLVSSICCRILVTAASSTVNFDPARRLVEGLHDAARPGKFLVEPLRPFGDSLDVPARLVDSLEGFSDAAERVARAGRLDLGVHELVRRLPSFANLACHLLVDEPQRPHRDPNAEEWPDATAEEHQAFSEVDHGPG
jgi:hypothetical protein